MKAFVTIIACCITTMAVAQNKPENWTKKKAEKWFKSKEWLGGAPFTPHSSVDVVEFARQYHANKKYWDEAFAFMKNNDIANMAPGKYPIDSTFVYASITADATKDFEKTNWESHRKYIDLQCVVTGEEKMGVVAVDKATVTKPYDEKKDVANYSAEGTFYVASGGTFFLFFPNDAHRPNIAPNGSQVEKKLVIKIRVAE